MKIKYSLIFLLLFACQFASAQSQDSAYSRHSLGITINPIYDNTFNTKHPVAYGLLYRYQYVTANSIRIGVFGAYESKHYTTTLTPHPAPQDTLIATKLFQFVIGHEWQYQTSKLFSVGYGLDLSPYVMRRHFSLDNILIGENVILNEQIDRKYKTIGVNLQPFLNFRYELSPKLYLVAECKASLGYSRERYSASGTWGDVNESLEDRGVFTGGAKTERINSLLLPLASLQLNFRL
ncbi:hypothetical protein H9Q13_13115 [Pontibacter sp. JH31]|uniref:Outer membrane protein beta-barrel domain-containing protein n=1 Tax=Pontibacter aquaedesilientis TaxID=2766980 RepID=A0ABR7XIM5_9BACT|nr:hypothetical protein [Pontibacter aquaedesilientis]MBD1398109.1 hypothetical protein [Pontibacter aquaedesilientis]